MKVRYDIYIRKCTYKALCMISSKNSISNSELVSLMIDGDYLTNQIVAINGKCRARAFKENLQHTSIMLSDDIVNFFIFVNDKNEKVKLESTQISGIIEYYLDEREYREHLNRRIERYKCNNG